MNNLIAKLKYWLKSKEKLFVDFQKFTIDFNDPKKQRIFIDRKSDILFVAHIDTVQKPKFIKKTKNRIYAAGLDDRLGCLIAHELSTELKTDLLICDLEESAKSTGQYHKLKEYNWIVEFDRAGNDVVTYDLDNIDFRQALSEYWEIGFGAFSDVCQLKTQACCVNVGIGYQHAHSKDSYVGLKTMRKQIAKFKQFFNEYKDTKFEQDLFVEFDEFNCDYSYKSSIGECEICGIMADVDYVFGHIICEGCFEDMYSQYCQVFWPMES